MTRSSVFLVGVPNLLTAVAAVGWAYTSHKYDCFNIGPCVGDIDYWIRLGDFAYVTFLASWAALLILTVLYSRRVNRSLVTASAWIVAILLPPVALLSANWVFNLGISVPPV